MELQAICNTVVAGTMESSDIMITLAPGNGGIEIELSSSVEKQYGEHIRGLLLQMLREAGIDNARVSAVDKGALDCTIRARMKTALCRYGAGGSGGERLG